MQFQYEYAGIDGEPEDKTERTLPLAKTMEGLSQYDDFGGSKVPRDIIALIFSHLRPEDLYKARRVCRTWYVIASNMLTLPRLFREAPIVDGKMWDPHVDLDKHCLVFEDIAQPRLYYKSDYEELSRMAAEVENNQGISFLTLPKGLTLNKVIAIAGAPKMGNSTKVKIWWDRIVEKYGDKEIEKTVTMAITNGVFNKSRNLNIAKQKELVEGLKCDMHEIVAVMALAIMRYISSDPDSPLRLFGDDPLTYTRCFEESAVFGGFAPAGTGAYYDDFDYENSGVGGQRTLEGDRY